MGEPRKYTLYRIFYGDEIVYVGRTKQPLQDRIRAHLSGTKMHRKIYIDDVAKIEQASIQSEADLCVYEIYYINLYHPRLNKSDKARDGLTVELPKVEWRPFSTPLWETWRQELREVDAAEKVKEAKRDAARGIERALRARRRAGEISEEEYWELLVKETW